MARQVLAGGVRAVARVITWIENQEPVGAVVLKRLTPPEKRAMVIGITGYPGTGKSTLIDQLIAAYRRLGKTVGVLAVDISSPLTGGAVLGDRIRMQRHADDAGSTYAAWQPAVSPVGSRGRLAMRCKSWKRPRMT